MTYETYQEAIKLDAMIQDTKAKAAEVQQKLSELTVEDKESCELKLGESSFEIPVECVEYLVTGLLNIENTYIKSLQDKFEAL